MDHTLSEIKRMLKLKKRPEYIMWGRYVENGFAHVITNVDKLWEKVNALPDLTPIEVPSNSVSLRGLSQDERDIQVYMLRGLTREEAEVLVKEHR